MEQNDTNKTKSGRIVSRFCTPAWLSLVVSIAIGIYSISNVQQARKYNEESSRLAKYQQTIDLCQKFDDWYHCTLVKADDKDFVEAKLWDQSFNPILMFSHQDTTQLAPNELVLKEVWDNWQSSSHRQKLNKLQYNTTIRKMLGYLQTAMLLDQAHLLERDYFYAYFHDFIHHLGNTSNSDPSVMELFSTIEGSEPNPSIGIAYWYCKNIIDSMDG